MAYVRYNPNPNNQRVGDCAVRAIAKALNKDWEDAYVGLCAEGLFYHDMPSANYVWGMFLRKHGFEQKMVPSICPACVTIADFAKGHPNGTYVVASQGHVCCIQNGSYFDSWDSGSEVVLYFWEKEE